MCTDDDGKRTEYSDAGYPIEIYTDERIREFMTEDTMTAEQKRRIDEKLKQPLIRKP